MRPISLTVCLLLLACPLAAQAQEKVTLKFKVLEGQESTVLAETETDQTLTLTVGGMDMDVQTGATQSKTLRSKTGQRGPDGKIRTENAIEHMSANISLPNGEIQFDSNDDEHVKTGSPADMLVDILAATAKAKWAVVYDANNRVVAVEVAPGPLQSLEPNVRQMVEQQFDPNYLKEQANNQIELFPNRPIAVGDTWRKSSEVRLDSGQSLTFTTDYKYEGTVQGPDGQQLDRVSVDTKEVSYAIDPNSPSPLRLKNSNLKVDSSDGYVLFDRERGHVREQSEKVHITGTMTFTAGGMEIPGKLDLTMKNTVKTKPAS